VLTEYHRAITLEAVGGQFSPTALEIILKANRGQDNLYGQIGHPHFHFDANSFVESWAYVAAQRAVIFTTLGKGKPRQAWQAFGRLTHALQDLYSHSNYVALWLRRFPENARPLPDEIDPLDESVFTSKELLSGKIYLPLDLMTFIPSLKEWAMQRLPRDSHAWMNLDAPGRGPLFPYAIKAAIKRTRHESEQIFKELDATRQHLFADF